MSIRKEIHIAIKQSQRVSIRLSNDKNISGLAEISNDTERVKVRTLEGPVWVPIEDIKHVSRVINMFNK